MNTQATTEIRPYVEILHGEIKTNSLKVAQHFGKSHKNVLRDIEKIIEQISNLDAGLKFELSEYFDSTGRKLPMYEMGKDAFVLLVMGYSGEKAMGIKITYINAFNTMERELSKNPLQLPGNTATLNLTFNPTDSDAARQRYLVTSLPGLVTITPVEPNEFVLSAERIRANLHDIFPGKALIDKSALYQLIGTAEPTAPPVIKAADHTEQPPANLPPGSFIPVVEPAAETIASTSSKWSTPETLIKRFIDDWQTPKRLNINAPFTPCLAIQAMQLFHLWARKQNIYVLPGDNKLMAALYHHPMFYRKRLRLRSERKGPKSVLMIAGAMPINTINEADWVTDCIIKMGHALTKMGEQ